MKVLITGYSGFIGSNLIEKLEEKYKDIEIYKFDVNSSLNEIEEYTKDCEFVFHFAATHRPKEATEFEEVNHGLTSYILESLEKHNNSCPFLYTSSIQAGNGSEYGNSKVNAENSVIEHGKKMGSRAIVYRLTNTFGKWARPNAHSVVATFCYNIQHNLSITINDHKHIMQLYYIDDVIESFINDLTDENSCAMHRIKELGPELTYKVSLGKIAELLYYFKECQDKNIIPTVNNIFEEKLLLTFESYKD